MIGARLASRTSTIHHGIEADREDAGDQDQDGQALDTIGVREVVVLARAAPDHAVDGAQDVDRGDDDGGTHRPAQVRPARLPVRSCSLGAADEDHQLGDEARGARHADDRESGDHEADPEEGRPWP